jgi:hypothetical protein
LLGVLRNPSGCLAKLHSGVGWLYTCLGQKHKNSVAFSEILRNTGVHFFHLDFILAQYVREPLPRPVYSLSAFQAKDFTHLTISHNSWLSS